MSRRERWSEAVSLEMARRLFGSIVEGMGTVLMRSAFSPNIKERRDYSCALFDARGRAVAVGDHMPVHLGSMPAAVSQVLRRCPPRAGEMVAVNDPYSGGTHLPDVTLVAPYPAAARRARYYLANRAHHSDIGGSHPGSMAPGAREIYEEGFILPPVRLVRRGEPDPDLLRVLLANVRTPGEREADLRAQIAANREGARLLEEMERRVGRALLASWSSDTIRHAARIVRSFLREVPEGVYRASEILEGDGVSGRSIRLQVCIRRRRGRIEVDFAGTDPQTRGNINAVEAITRSAVYFVFRCLVREDIPFNEGCFEAIAVRVPPGSVLAATRPSAVAGGNVEASQRVVDLVLKALAQALPDRIPAQSSGTMTNLTFGGRDPRTGSSFTYYETIGGGMGASRLRAGLSAVHTGMTNSLNTPVEALEQALPIRVTRYSLRPGSGGKGLHPGGCGVLREFEALGETQAAVFADRHRHSPSGARGGGAGAPGRVWILRGGKPRLLESKCRLVLRQGERLRIATPGGGGWGRTRRHG
jgi:N-methylhydantoinase B